MKMVLVDGNSLLFRAYYATAYTGNIMMTSKGEATNAVYALSNIITKLVNEVKPDYMLVAFDTDKPTFRHQEYADYKAGRKETPPELISQFPLARELVAKMGVVYYEKAGYEADDIIGTVSKKASEAGMEVLVYSGDRDLLQLIDNNVTVYLTKKGITDLKVMTPEALDEELGITPSQITDLKGLMGDSSDNIPGIAGVGEKTALKLLKEYHTVEKVVEADIGGKLGEKIKDQKEQALKSKHLATINRDMPFEYDFEHLKYQGPVLPDLADFYLRYEMQSQLKKLQFTPKSEDVKVEEVNKLPIDAYQKKLAFYLFVKGDNYHRDELIGLGISDGAKNYFLSIDNLKEDEALKAYLSDESKAKSGFDVKRIIVGLRRVGIEVKGFDFDILLATYLLSTSLKEEAAYIFNFYNIQIPFLSSIFVRGKYEMSAAINYAGSVANATHKLEEECLKKVKDLGLDKLLFEIEMPLTSILAEMEINGIKLDLEMLKEKSNLVNQKLASLSKEIYDLAGEEYNIQSPAQTAMILFDKLNLPANRKRSTSADELALLVNYHPIVAKILEHRKYSKLLSVYLEGLPSYVLDDGKVHTIYNQALTQTGRLSSRDPNLQNITIRTTEGREVRKAFIAENDGCYILSFDYSQIELRVLAHMANANSMIEVFNRDGDPHKETASKIFGVPVSEVTDAMRRHAKTVNFGIVYGMSDWGLSDELGIPVGTAKNFIESYYAQYPEIKAYFDKVIEDCRDKGYVKTLYGRIRWVKEINDKNYNLREFGKRVAKNTPIQGTAADIMKIAMIKVYKALKEKEFKTKLLLQVHDELVFEVPYDELNEVIELVSKLMGDFPEFKVKLKSDYHYGFSWYK